MILKIFLVSIVILGMVSCGRDVQNSTSKSKTDPRRAGQEQIFQDEEIVKNNDQNEILELWKGKYILREYNGRRMGGSRVYDITGYFELESWEGKIRKIDCYDYECSGGSFSTFNVLKVDSSSLKFDENFRCSYYSDEKSILYFDELKYVRIENTSSRFKVTRTAMELDVKDCLFDNSPEYIENRENAIIEGIKDGEAIFLY